MIQKAMLGSVALSAVCCLSASADWPAFRGGPDLGVAQESTLPKELNAESNPLWSAELPGRGPSSPIVVGDKVIVTASSGAKQDRLHVLAFDAKTGNQLWERQFWATGRTATHPTSAVAANTPCSDGERIFAFYSSNDLVCLDLDGKLLWYRGLAYDYPHVGNDAGMASSPLVVGPGVIVQIESQGESFVASLDRATGETLWRVERPREASWASPTAIVDDQGNVAAVLVQSKNRLSALDPASGEEFWSIEGGVDLIPSAVQQGNLLAVPFDGLTMFRLASDRTKAPEKLWSSNKLRPGAASPIIAGGRVLALNRGGVLAAGLPDSGEVDWQVRLDGSFWSSPVVSGDRLYCASDDGVLQVVPLEGDREQISSLPLGEAVQGSPAVADGALFVRSDRHLFKIGDPADR
ncbi:MAG TPA: PQQ-binding-like beta-propeller repeat protein [Pirellulaceae bacterium]|jgi:outer membrane protein assembly factor BamB|nr:PQQ-binding-like beta-propeller repeat protein [Pirellulaceae bacterium]